jgi:hypothetical protein
MAIWYILWSIWYILWPIWYILWPIWYIYFIFGLLYQYLATLFTAKNLKRNSWAKRESVIFEWCERRRIFGKDVLSIFDCNRILRFNKRFAFRWNMGFRSFYEWPKSF